MGADSLLVRRRSPSVAVGLAVVGALLAGLLWWFGAGGGGAAARPTGVDATAGAAQPRPVERSAAVESGADGSGRFDGSVTGPRIPTPGGGRSTPTVAPGAEMVGVALSSDPPPGPPAILAGVVRDAVGRRPIAGVQLALERDGQRAEARTDEQGRFQLGWTAGHAGRLSVVHPQYVDLFRAEQSAPAELDLALEPSAQLLVWLEPAPPPEALSQLFVWWRRSARPGDWTAHAGRLGAEGRVEFVDLAPGEYALAGRVGGQFVPLRAGLDLAPGQLRVERVVLEAGGVLRGRATDERDRPLAGVRVELVPRSSGLPPDAERARGVVAETEADGEYELRDVAPGPYRLRATTTYGDTRQTELEFEAGAEFRHDLEFAAPVRTTGHVSALGGGAVAGALVRCLPRRDRDGLQSLLLPPGPGAPGVRTDERGEFVLEDLPPGEFLVLVVHPPESRPELAPAQLHLPRLAAEGPAEALEVVLGTGNELRGVVLAAGAETPLEGAEVRLSYTVGRSAVPHSATRTDAEGTFRLQGAPDGSGWLEVEAAGHRPARESVELEDGRDLGEFRFELTPIHPLVVRVLDPEGFGVGGLLVGVQPAYPADAEQDQRRSARERARVRTTDVVGDAYFDAVDSGPLDVYLPGTGFELLEVDPARPQAPEDGRVTLVVRAERRDRTVRLFGTAVRREDGAAVEGLEVDGLEGGVLVVRGERFEVGGVTPGRREPRLLAPGRLPVDLGPQDLLPGSEVDLGAHYMEPATEVVVRLEDPSGAPLDGANVLLRGLDEAAGGLGRDAPVLRLRGAGGGRYTYAWGQPAVWQLVVRHAEHPTHRETVEVKAGPRFDHTSRLSE
jgi:hypothetical protein